MLIALRSVGALTRGQAQVDAPGGAIRNVAVMTAGPALGHGFNIDQTMLGQVADQIARKGGVAVNYSRSQVPGQTASADKLGTHIGRLLNPRLDGQSVRGDIQFGKHSTNVPSLGNVQRYLMELADYDPTQFGLSPVYRPADYAVDRQSGAVLGRSDDVMSCDVTGETAANPTGLLSALAALSPLPVIPTTALHPTAP